MKLNSQTYPNPSKKVAPYTGAWIEILIVHLLARFVPVAPYTGAWIEIYQSNC